MVFAALRSIDLHPMDFPYCSEIWKTFYDLSCYPIECSEFVLPLDLYNQTVSNAVIRSGLFCAQFDSVSMCFMVTR